MISATDTRVSADASGDQEDGQAMSGSASASNDDSVSLDARAAREKRIRQAAYAAAEQRGFEPGYEMQDWLEAERQVDAQGDAPAADQAP